MTLTIPPVEERQTRECVDLSGPNDCIFSQLFNGSKECHPDGEHRRHKNCPRHFTQAELWELIDQHNQKEINAH